METKICSKCLMEKSLDFFYNSKKYSLGVGCNCIDCEKQRRKAARQRKREEMILAGTPMRKAHDKNETQEEYKQRMRDKANKFYLKNSEVLLEKNREYWKDKKRTRTREQKNKMNKRLKERRENDPVYKISSNCRVRFRNGLKGNPKSAKTEALIGCSFEFLKDYLESKFSSGMSWENYGEWHIDHIKPISKFNLLCPEEQKKCFHYTNLQPLWAKDNFKKGNRFKEVPQI
jgi:hypothetical protein